MVVMVVIRGGFNDRDGPDSLAKLDPVGRAHDSYRARRRDSSLPDDSDERVVAVELELRDRLAARLVHRFAWSEGTVALREAAQAACWEAGNWALSEERRWGWVDTQTEHAQAQGEAG